MDRTTLPANHSGMAAIRAFVRLSRLHFLAGGVLGVALGAAMARWTGRTLDMQTFVLVQAYVTCAQLMTHYCNEYFDRESDALAQRTAFSGGSGVLVEGHLRPNVALNAALVLLFLALCALAALAGLGKWNAVAIGSTIAVLSWEYSAPPLRLHSRGVGELATAAVVGMLVPLFAFAALAGTVSALAIVSALPAACAMFVMMLCVELPDISADAATGKRNLLVRFGSAAAPTLIAVAVSVLLLAAAVAVRMGAPRPFVIVALAGVILGTWLRGRLNGSPAPPHGWTAAMGVAMFVVTMAASATVYALAV